MRHYDDPKVAVYAEMLHQLLQLGALLQMLGREMQLHLLQPLPNAQLREHASQNPRHL
jgi:hypothetical protein